MEGKAPGQAGRNKERHVDESRSWLAFRPAEMVQTPRCPDGEFRGCCLRSWASAQIRVLPRRQLCRDERLAAADEGIRVTVSARLPRSLPLHPPARLSGTPQPLPRHPTGTPPGHPPPENIYPTPKVIKEIHPPIQFPMDQYWMHSK